MVKLISPRVRSARRELDEPKRASLSRERPFPGPEPYRESDAAYFFGRDDEIEALERLVRRNPLTLLYGASGLGKTSLLRAGLIPKLRPQNLFPILLRIDLSETAAGGANGSPLERQVMLRIRAEAGAAGLDCEQADDHSTLWEFLHCVELWGPTASLLEPVIILDQFEELFTLGEQTPALRDASSQLFSAIGDVVDNRVPARLLLRSREAERYDDFLRRRPPAKVVLSLREEYLPHLEAKKHEIASIMQSRSRYWLRPLPGDRAKQVVLQAAQGRVKPEVAEQIVLEVTERREGLKSRTGGSRRTTVLPKLPRPLSELHVEPSLLNLFCYQLNERRIRDRAQQIELALVTKAGLDILDEFYGSCLAGLDRQVERFLERRLISPLGYRLPLPEQEALEQPGVNARVIELLEARRLIRREFRHETNYIEIVHDVLSDTILRARARREAALRQRWITLATGGATAITAVLSLAALGYYGVDVHSDVKRLHEEYRVAEKRKDEQVKLATQAQEQATQAQEQKDLQLKLAGEAESKTRDAEARAKVAEGDAEAARSKAEELKQQLEELTRTLAESRKRVRAEEDKAREAQRLAGEAQAREAFSRQQNEELEAHLKQLDADRKALEADVKRRQREVSIPDSL